MENCIGLKFETQTQTETENFRTNLIPKQSTLVGISLEKLNTFTCADQVWGFYMHEFLWYN